MIVKVCTWKSCSDKFSLYILKRLLAEKMKFDTENKSIIEECSCQWHCNTWPNIIINNSLSDKINPVKASNLYLEAL